MSKGYKFFAFLSRLKYLYRWPLMRNTVRENVFEHTAQVALLAHGLAIMHNKYFNGNVNTEKIVVMALYHDASEAITSDLPTPIKYYNDAIRAAFKEMEEEANKQILNMMPEELRVYYEPYFECNIPHDSEEWKILKAADKLAAYLKCVEELKSGNKEFRRAKKNCIKSLNEMNLPVIDYFMKHFAPSFNKALHEL